MCCGSSEASRAFARGLAPADQSWRDTDPETDRSTRIKALPMAVARRWVGHGGSDRGDKGMTVKRLRFAIGSGPGDFMPLVIGAIFLFISAPGFVLLLIQNGEDFGGLELPVLWLLGAGVILGLGFLVYGLQLCAEPGSLLYRLAHGR